MPIYLINLLLRIKIIISLKRMKNNMNNSFLFLTVLAFIMNTTVSCSSEDDTVCCESYGYGSNMEKCCETYELT